MHGLYAEPVRTTLQLDDELIREAKVVAARTGRTLSQVIEDALRQTLVPRQRQPRQAPPLPTSPGTLRQGVDLDDNARLRDLMEDDDLDVYRRST
jgi:plasmid stability protein